MLGTEHAPLPTRNNSLLVGAFSLRVSKLYSCLGFSEQVCSLARGQCTLARAALGWRLSVSPIILQDWGGGQPLFLLRKLPATSRLTRDFSREVNCGGFSRCSLGDGEALGPVGHHWFEIPNIPSGLVAVTLPVALLSAPKTCFLSETAALIQAS